MEGQGPLTITGIESLLYMKTNNSISSDPKYPDIEILQSMATVGFDTGKKFPVEKKIQSLEFISFDTQLREHDTGYVCPTKHTMLYSSRLAIEEHSKCCRCYYIPEAKAT